MDLSQYISPGLCSMMPIQEACILTRLISFKHLIIDYLLFYFNYLIVGISPPTT